MHVQTVEIRPFLLLFHPGNEPRKNCAHAFDVTLDDLATRYFSVGVRGTMCAEVETGVAEIHCDCCCLYKHTFTHKHTLCMVVPSLQRCFN